MIVTKNMFEVPKPKKKSVKRNGSGLSANPQMDNNSLPATEAHNYNKSIKAADSARLINNGSGLAGKTDANSRTT